MPRHHPMRFLITVVAGLMAWVGPEINWRPTFLPGFQAGFRASWDFGARNSSQGFFSLLHFLYSFPAGE